MSLFICILPYYANTFNQNSQIMSSNFPFVCVSPAIRVARSERGRFLHMPSRPLGHCLSAMPFHCWPSHVSVTDICTGSVFTLEPWWPAWWAPRCRATVCSATLSTPPAGWRAPDCVSQCHHNHRHTTDIVKKQSFNYYGFQTVCKCIFRTFLVTVGLISTKLWHNKF